MTPVIVIIWVCVAVFIITALLTLLHISGIRPLPDASHGNVLFRALIVEVIVVAVGAFASSLLPKDEPPLIEAIPGSMNNAQGVFSTPATSDGVAPLLPASAAVSGVESLATQPQIKSDKNCNQITVSDASIFPPTLRIETICN